MDNIRKTFTDIDYLKNKGKMRKGFQDKNKIKYKKYKMEVD